MKKYKNIIILINLLILVVLFNKSVLKKEKTLTEGTLVLLKLAPVDPRSLMQGDYMRLRYEIARNLRLDTIAKRGYCVVKLSEKGIAKKIRLQNNTTPLENDAYLINYTSNKWDINFGAESFFFQEGNAKKFEKAKYGGLKIDNSGESILIGLYDENLKKIEVLM